MLLEMGDPNQIRHDMVENISRKWEKKPEDPGYNPEMIKEITDKWEKKPEDPGYNPEMIKEITDKWRDKVSNALTSEEILDNLNEDNCCDRLLKFFKLFHKAGIQKRGLYFVKVSENGEEERLFETRAIIIPEEMFNKGELTAYYITVNPISSSGEGSLQLSDIDNTEEYAPWKESIIRFIQDHAKYLSISGNSD